MIKKNLQWNNVKQQRTHSSISCLGARRVRFPRQGRVNLSLSPSNLQACVGPSDPNWHHGHVQLSRLEHPQMWQESSGHIRFWRFKVPPWQELGKASHIQPGWCKWRRPSLLWSSQRTRFWDIVGWLGRKLTLASIWYQFSFQTARKVVNSPT